MMDQQEMSDFPFLGEFTYAGETFTVLPEHYLELGDLSKFQSVQGIIKAVKVVAVQLAGRPNNLNKNAMQNFIDEDPVPRFAGNVLLVDGDNLAHRCRHVFNLTNKGKDVSVLFGFLKVLQANARKFKANAILIAWDQGAPSYRRKRIPSYKANRSRDDDDTWEEFLLQKDELMDILPYFGVVSVSNWRTEADDLLYHTSRVVHPDWHCIVMSNDKDLLQAVDYHTSVVNGKDELINLKNFEAEVGVQRKHYLVYKALIGDSSDNLPGAFGIGEVTAKKLVAAYDGSTAGMINAANGNNPEGKWMTDSVGEKLRKFGLSGFANHMAVMRLDYDQCGARNAVLDEVNYWLPYDHRIVKQYLLKYGFVSLADGWFYDTFKELKKPVLDTETVRYPVVIGDRRPVEDGDTVPDLQAD